MPATYNWRLPETNQKQAHSTEWEGSGWYITTRRFPGTETYVTWRVDPYHGDMRDVIQRNNAERSLGGSIRYLKEEPAG